MIWQLVVPAIVTVICNVIFYRYVKKEATESLEKYKVAYSGLYKERILVYKEILKKLINIKKAVTRFDYSDDVEARDIMNLISDFIDFTKINEPFISPKVNGYAQKIRGELQVVFDAFYRYKRYMNQRDFFERKEVESKYDEALNLLRSKEIFEKLNGYMIEEMRKDLGFDKI